MAVLARGCVFWPVQHKPAGESALSTMADLSTATKALLITSRTFGGLSLLACICTGLEATADWRLGKGTIVTRIQTVLQYPIAFYSVATILGTSLAPGAWLSVGSAATCNVQGFTILFSVCSGLLLDMSLSLYYLLLVKYGWNEAQLRRIEPYLHAFIWPFVLAISVYSAAQNLYGYTLESCFLMIPEDCSEAAHSCTPTPSSLEMVRLIMLGMNMIHLIFSMYVMHQVCGVAMREHEEETSRLVAIKGTLYTLVVTVAEVPVAIWLIFYFFTGYEANGLWTISTLALPLLGFFNLLVFMLNRRKMNTSYGVLWRKAIDWATYSCCCCFNAEAADPDTKPDWTQTS